MSASNSPEWQLRKEAKRMAHHLKRMRFDKERIKFAIVMDDKTIVIEMDVVDIRKHSEEALEAMVYKHARGEVLQ